MDSLKENFLIRDISELRGHYPDTHPLAVKKCQPRLDGYSKEFISRSPFLCISSQGRDGRADVSPRGDPPGFVKLLSDTLIAIPDRPGNNRLDTLTNILENSSIGLLFLVPGFDDTLRINGKAAVSRDPEILEQMAVRDRAPTVAIVVEVAEVFLHCAKAFRRSQLWSQESHQARNEMPSLAKMILDQTTGAPESEEDMNKINQELEEEYRRTMY